MKLYSAKLALSPWKVLIFIAEKGIKNIEIINLDLANKEHKTDEYKAIAPNSRVPSLVLDDGTAILETSAICRYLECLYPEPNLFGESPMEIATIEMWYALSSHELMLPLAHGFRHTHPGMKELENQNEEFGLAQREVARKSLKYFDKVISDREFIAGERFTYADIQVASVLMYLVRLNKIELSEYENLSEYITQVSRRPSFSI
jgi:glutathione S-transferase